MATGLCDRIEIQLAYAIGVANPVSLFVETFGTEKVSIEEIYRVINEVFDLSPGSLIRNLDLRKPIYRQVAAYGHFGRNDLDLPWERLNKVEEIKNSLKQKSISF